MAETTKITGEQFLAALKRQGPISTLLDAAKRVDVSGLSEDESKNLARGIKDFAGTKNGPMLIMGLPGHLQALMSFYGTTMPGLDRLGYLKASPRQALDRLSHITDDKLLSHYQFDKVSKSDWIYYLERCTTAFIPPFVRFLKCPESAGGFSDKEISTAVLVNRRLVDSVPIERIDPDSATELIVSGMTQPFWQKYDFDRFGKEHWRTILKKLNVTDIPKPCERFLANTDGKGFSTAELIELAHSCDLIEKWIDPDEVAFSDAYDLYVNGKGRLLWRRYPFSGLNRSEWEVILKNREIDIPSAFISAVNFGMFTADDLCTYAVNNPKVFPFVGIDSISPHKLVDLLLQCDAQYLWDHYPFAKLTAEDWLRLICNHKDSCVVPHAEMLGDSEGMSKGIATQILTKKDAYLKVIPLVYVDPGLAVDLMTSGRHDELWSQYDFTRFGKEDWRRLFSKTDHVPTQFSTAVKQGMFSVPELCALAKKNAGFIDYVPIEKLIPSAFIDLFLATRSKKLWSGYDFSRLTGLDWKRLVCSLKTNGIVNTAKHIKDAPGLTMEIVSSLLKVNPGYYKYVPVEMISTDDVIKVLLSGECEAFWGEYPFALFDDEDWFALLENTRHALPDEGMVFLANEDGKVDVARLNLLLAKRRDLVGYLNPRDIDPKLAAEFLVRESGSVLWGKYDFGRFSDKQVLSIVAKSSERESWPKEISNRFASDKNAFSDSEILTLAEKNIVNVLELLSPKRIHRSGVQFFEKVCDLAKTSKPAIALITRKLTIGEKPWLELQKEYQVVLLAAIPLCRKFTDWQSFELKLLDKLLTADKAFKSELRGWRKFNLFVWRHWLFLTILIIIAVCLSYRAVCDFYEQARLKMVAARQDFVVRQINALEECGDYEALDRYLGTVAQGEDAHLLEDDRTAEARSELKSWKRKRELVSCRLEILRRMVSEGWPVEKLDYAEDCFKILQNNSAVNPIEKEDIEGLRRACDSRRAEIARQKKNADFATRIADIEKRCCKALTIEAAQAIISELEPICSDSDIDDANTERCSRANIAMFAYVESMFRRELSTVQQKIDKSKSISEIEQIALSIEKLLSYDQVSKSVKAECESLMAMISRRKVALLEAAEKIQVDDIHKEVVRLTEGLGSSDRSGFETISTAYSQLKNMNCFARYSKDYADEYTALGVAVKRRKDGIAKADAVIASAIDSMESLEDKIVTSTDVDAVAQHLQALESWTSEFASIVEWRREDVERCRKRLADVCDGIKDRISLVMSINRATDYGALHDSIQALIKRHSNCAECRQIDVTRVMSESQVKSAITKSGWFSSEVFCEFVGVIKVCPQNATDVVPILTKKVDAKAEIFCVGMHYDSDSQKWAPTVKKIFERTRNGGFRKVVGMSYDKCQGIGLFICKDPSYVDIDSWVPGTRNPEHQHWFASRKPGVWIVEPGYEKISVFAGELSEVKWAPNKRYGENYRTDRMEGCWQYLGDCYSCSCSGSQTYEYNSWTCPRCNGTGKIEVRSSFGNWYNPARCTSCKGNPRRKSTGRKQCPSCRGRGTAWYDMTPTDAKKFVERLIAEA